MPKIFNLGNPNFKSPATCSEIGPVEADLRDRTAQFCQPNTIDPCQEVGRKKKWGEKANSDPMQAGSIINDMTKETRRDVIYRYSNALRGCNQAMQDLFTGLVVIDPDGVATAVPLIYGSQERAVAYLQQNNARKDNTLVVDRPVLPLLAIKDTDYSPNRERYAYHKALYKPELHDELKTSDISYAYARGIPIDIGFTLHAWTHYIEDMNQIVEQIWSKFSPFAYIKVQGLLIAETKVRLDAVGNNIDDEVGDQSSRVCKFTFNMTAETYIPQPIIRKRTVLNIKTDFFNSVDETKMNEVYGRQEVE